MQYDVIIIGAGPGGIFSAYELSKLCPDKKIAVFEEGQPLEKRRCPIDGKTVKHCIGCPTCAIMNGFGGAGAFSDGKYNLTNDFGGTLYEYIGKKQAMELMHYVDEINVSHGGENTKLYSTANSAFKTRCLQCGLHLLDASVRHLGTDINFVVLKNLFAELEPKVDFHFRTPRAQGPGQGRRLRDRHRLRQPHLQPVHHLRRPQRQQVDGERLQGPRHRDQVQPRRHRRARRAARRNFQAPDRRAVREQDRLQDRKNIRISSAPSA